MGSVDEVVKKVLNEVLDVSPEEINGDKTLDQAFAVDSTEMVDISVKLKRALSLDIGDSELKKTHTFDDIVSILTNKSVI